MVSRTAIAVILSVIIAGLGQIYLGRVKRGIVILISGFGIGFLSGFLLPFPISILPAVAFWIWNIYDAYKLARRLALEPARST